MVRRGTQDGSRPRLAYEETSKTGYIPRRLTPPFMSSFMGNACGLLTSQYPSPSSYSAVKMLLIAPSIAAGKTVKYTFSHNLICVMPEGTSGYFLPLWSATNYVQQIGGGTITFTSAKVITIYADVALTGNYCFIAFASVPLNANFTYTTS